MRRLFIILIIFFSPCWVHAQCIEDFMKVVKENPHLNVPVNNDPSLIFAWNTIKGRPQMSVDLDILYATNRMLKNNAGWIAEYEELFNKILENLGEAGARCRSCKSPGYNMGIPFIDVTIDDISSIVKRTEGKQNVQNLLNEMGQSWQKADGAAFILNVLRHKSDDFIKSIEKFEYKYLDDENFEADISLIGGKNIEYKSYKVSTWEKFGSENQIAQLKAYIKVGNFEYVANAAKLNSISGNPTDFVRKQFQRVMKKEGVAEALFLSNPSYFKKITYKNQDILIDSDKQLRYYLEQDDFFTSSLFNKIGVE